MPTYEFQTRSGDVVEAVFPAEGPKHPKVGDRVVIDGVEAVRIFSRVTLGSNFSAWTYPYLSNALPRGTPGCKMVRDPKTGRPKPLIESARHERDVAARNELVKGL